MRGFVRVMGGIVGVIGLFDLYNVWEEAHMLHNMIYVAVCCFLIVEAGEGWDGNQNPKV